MLVCSFCGGMAIGFPDACKTPVPPVPYPNFAPGFFSVPVAANVLAGGTPWLTTLSPRVATLGDTAGIGLGVISQTINGRQQYVTGSFTTVVRGGATARVTSMGPGNVINAPICVCSVPSQFVVMDLAA